MADFIRGKPQKRKNVDSGISAPGGLDLAAPPAENDFLFSMRDTKRSRYDGDRDVSTANSKTLKKKEAKRRKKERERKEALEEQNKKAFGSAPSSLKVPNHIHLLSFSRLHVGVKLLAVVRQVRTRHAVLSLPNSLTGHLALRDVSDYISHLSPAELKSASYDMKKMFYPGQFVLCAISNLDKSQRKRIDLTTKASIINEGLRLEDLGEDLVSQINGHVNSIEDHGYVISLGVKSATAFLPFANISSKVHNGKLRKDKSTSDRADSDQLIVGQPLTLMVKSVNVKGRSIICKLKDFTVEDPSSFPSQHVVNSANIGMQSLTPGMLVKATVKKVMKSGLYCTFLRYFGASIDVYHMKKPASSGWVERNVYSVGDTTIARIVMVDNVNKIASLSAAPHVVNLKAKEFSCQKGDVFNRAMIARVDKGTGLLLNCTGYIGNAAISNDGGSESDSDTEMTGEEVNKKVSEVAYTHISRVSDSKTENLSKYRDKIVKCRIVGFSEFDGMALASLKESIISAKIFSIADVKTGIKIKGKIKKVDKKAVVCSIGEDVTGIILPEHLAEVKLQNLEDHFKVGKFVNCRVLQIDTKHNKVLLTCKRVLVTSPNEIISSYSEDYVDSLAHGFVTAIKDYGIIVTFYNNVHGLVSIEDMEKHGIHEPALAYNVGQSVFCKVLSVQANKGRMRLSFHTKDAGSSREMNVLPEKYSVGEIINSIQICKIDNEKSEAVFDLGENIRGTLHKSHLSDHEEHCNNLFERLSVNDILEDLIVIDVRKTFQRNSTFGWQIVFSKKPSFLEAKEKALLPLSEGDLTVGRLFCGYIHNITAFGIFVRFLGRVTVYVPKSNISEDFVENPNDFFSAGQTVWTKIIRAVESPGESAIGTLKAVLCDPSQESIEFRSLFLKSYLAEVGDYDLDSDGSKHNLDWKSYPLGTVVKGKVLKEEQEGFLLDVDGTKAFCQKQHAPKRKYKKGAAVKCMVIDLEIKNNMLNVTMDTKSVAAGAKKSTKRFKLNQTIDATVLLSKEKYYVVELPSSAHKNTIGFLERKSYNGKYILNELSIGDSVAASVSHVARANAKKYPGRTTLLTFPKDWSKDGDGTTNKTTKKEETVFRGALIDCIVKDVKRDSLEVEMKILKEAESKRYRASVFLTDIVDLNSTTAGNENAIVKMRSFEVGSEIQARCLWTNSSKSKNIQSVQDDAKAIVAQLSVRDSEVSSNHLDLEKRLSWRDAALFEDLSELYGVVLDVTNSGAWIAISPILKGFAFCTNCSYDDDIETLNKHGVKGILQVGQIVPLSVLSVDESNHTLELSLRKIDIDRSMQFGKNEYKAGDVLIGKTISIRKEKNVKVIQPPAINIQTSKGVYGRVCITHLKDKKAWLDVPFGHKSGKKEKKGMVEILPGKYVKSVILKRDNDRLDLSLRNSIITLAEENVDANNSGWLADAIDKQDSIKNLEVGDIVKGYVVETVPVGCFVRLSPTLTGRVMITNLSDAFIKHTKKVFYPTKLVVGKILTLDKKSCKIELTLKKSAVKEKALDENGSDRVNFKSIEVGQILEGTVSKVESYGVFVKLLQSGNPGISGLCHISEATDKFVKNLGKLFKVGDLVKTKVIKKNIKDKKLSLSLKPSNFDDSTSKAKDLNRTFESSDDSDSDDESASKDDKEVSATRAGDQNKNLSDDESENDSENSSESDSEADEKAINEATRPSKKRMQSADYISSSSSDEDINSSGSSSDEEVEESQDSTSKQVFSFKGFDRFTAGNTSNDDESESDDDESESDDDMDGTKKKKSRSRSSKKKLRERRKEESAIVAEEEALVEGNKIPTSVNDFEKAILSSPNSSIVWIKYMAFQLSMTEVDLARGIAERALKQINYREFDEKLNVWLAYINLEYKYGDEKSFEHVFKRAMEVNDAVVVFRRVATILFEARDPEKAHEMYKRAMKKHGSKSISLWTDYGLFAIKTKNRYVKFQDVLSQALQRMPSRESISIITKFALLEFKNGTPERARTMFEEILANYPKRVDIWNMYLDQEISIFAQKAETTSVVGKKATRIQKLFNRVISLKFSSKKMKFFFKKYLQFEQQHGTADGEERVKALAREWVQSQ